MSEFKVGDKVGFLSGSGFDNEDVGIITRPHEYLACNWYAIWEKTQCEEAAHENQLTLLVSGEAKPLVHTYVFNKHDNGGESLFLKTTLHDAGTEDQFVTQEITLQSYCRSSSFTIPYDLSPDQLRELADQLEAFVPKLPK